MSASDTQTTADEPESRETVWGHVSKQTAALIRSSAKRRKRSLSFVVAEILDEWAAEKISLKQKAS